MTEAGAAENDAQTVETLHSELRRQILSGHYEPGVPLSQVKLARSLGVGRTPLREALRMLQREGLVDAEYNRRARVSPISMSGLDQVYARRIILEALGIRISVHRFSTVDHERLQELVSEMEVFVPDIPGHLEQWEAPHKEFHRMLVQYAGGSLIADVAELQDHAQRYRAILGPDTALDFTAGHDEHRRLVAACKERNPDEAGRLMARHLARSATGLISHADPAYDALALREALRIVLGDSAIS